MISESKFWNNFGKFSAVVGTIAAIVTLVAFFSRSGSEEIDLYIETSKYRLIPVVEETINENRSLLRSIELRDEISSNLPQELDPKEKRNILDAMQKMSEKNLEIYDQASFDSYGGISFLNLENTGTVAASDLIIDFPYEGMVQLTYADGTEKIQEFKTTIKVGKLRAGTEVSLIVWSQLELSEYALEQINVTHKSGKGSVHWPVSTNWYGRFIGEYLYFTPLIVYILLMIGGYFGSLTKKSIHSEDDSDEEA